MSKRPPAWLKPHGRPWTDKGGRTIYDNRWIRVSEHEATAPTGKPATYGMVHFKNLAMAILPLHEDATVTLVGQHRFALRDYSWEIPEGGGALDVPPLESAKRELREEVGLEASDWREVLRVQLSNSITDERAVGYLAMAFSRVEKDPDDSEDLAVIRVPFAEALQAALDGWLEDVLTVAMLLRVHHMAAEGELPADLAQLMLRRSG